MTTHDISPVLGYKAIIIPNAPAPVTTGYTSDLLSDVMGNAPDQSVLITIQGHKNTVAVASLVGISAIILCNGRSAPDDMQAAAEKEQIAIFSTSDNQFAVSYKLARALQLP